MTNFFQATKNYNFKFFKSNKKWWSLFLFPKGKLTILNIAFLGLLLGLGLITNKFIDWKFIPHFRIQFGTLWMIIVPLIYGFCLGLLYNFILDFITLFFRGGIGEYMWQFILIYVFITIIVSAFRMIFYFKDKKWYKPLIITSGNIFFIIIAVLAIGFQIWAYEKIYIVHMIGKKPKPVAYFLSLSSAIIGIIFAFFAFLLTIIFGNTIFFTKTKQYGNITSKLISIWGLDLVFNNFSFFKKNIVNLVSLKKKEINEENKLDAIVILTMIYFVTFAIDIVYGAYAYIAFTKRMGYVQFPFYYWLAMRTPEKIFINFFVYLIVQAIYSASKFVFKDTRAEIKYE